MNRGSWMSDGTCSETGGGVHQICIKNIANNATGFSKKQVKVTGLIKEELIIIVFA